MITLLNIESRLELAMVFFFFNKKRIIMIPHIFNLKLPHIAKLLSLHANPGDENAASFFAA